MWNSGRDNSKTLDGELAININNPKQSWRHQFYVGVVTFNINRQKILVTQKAWGEMSIILVLNNCKIHKAEHMKQFRWGRTD